jgi:hypothetical protein
MVGGRHGKSKGHHRMFEWALSDLHSVILVLICVALVTIVIALNRARRAEIVRLQNEVKQLSLSLRALQAVEERRFILELKAIGKGAEPAIDSSSAKVSAISDGGKHQSAAA